jgi:hypothetical protein
MFILQILEQTPHTAIFDTEMGLKRNRTMSAHWSNDDRTMITPSATLWIRIATIQLLCRSELRIHVISNIWLTWKPSSDVRWTSSKQPPCRQHWSERFGWACTPKAGVSAKAVPIINRRQARRMTSR